MGIEPVLIKCTSHLYDSVLLKDLYAQSEMYQQQLFQVLLYYRICHVDMEATWNIKRPQDQVDTKEGSSFLDQPRQINNLLPNSLGVLNVWTCISGRFWVCSLLKTHFDYHTLNVYYHLLIFVSGIFSSSEYLVCIYFVRTIYLQLCRIPLQVLVEVFVYLPCMGLYLDLLCKLAS